MCGRFTSHHSAEEIVERFDVEDVLFPHTPRFNLAPTQFLPAITAVDGRCRLQAFRWGLIPSWAKDDSFAARMINARAETVADKPAFRTPLQRRRCLIPADGWYEWKKSAGGKQPHYFQRRDGGLFAFAGLWDEWQTPDSSPLQTCTIITVAPNETAAEIHDRMPAILRREDEARWLDPASRNVPELAELLVTTAPDEFVVFPVARAVNSPLTDSADLIC